MQTLESEHNRSMRDIDAKFSELKRSIPANILKMKLRDVNFLKDFNDVLVEEKMSRLDITIKETVQKADEGKSWLIVSIIFRYIWFSLHLSHSHTIFHLHPSCRLKMTSHNKDILQKPAIAAASHLTLTMAPETSRSLAR